MSNNLFQFNFEHDQQPTENQYPISDMQFVYINDSNMQNYSNGFINFSNISITGSNIDKMFDWSQGYITIPYSVVVTPSGGANGLNLFKMMQM
jgi:hypothetical protein